MWTVAVDSDGLVRFLLKNATMVERVCAVLDGEQDELTESEVMRLLTKIHQSLAGMASYLKLRKENELEGNGDYQQGLDGSARDGHVPRGQQVGVAHGDGGSGPEGTAEAKLRRAERTALSAATFRNRGRPRTRRRRGKK